MSKKELFNLLDELEKNTREAGKRAVDQVCDERGAAAREPYNFGHYTFGSIIEATDPYFPFSQAVSVWGRSFSAMGIKYRNAELKLDLLARTSKYENGFMHGPVPSYIEAGKFKPARIGFTSFAVPGQVGAGLNALNTLVHEGGHAAHFSNITMPSPAFSQEFAPTSVAFAETQSMFLDRMVSDPDWRVRYARDLKGNPMPVELIEQAIDKEQRYLVCAVRGMLGIVYSEKAIYEIPEDQLNATTVLKKLREEEQRLTFLTASRRPTLAVPHLIAGESSAYYHGYVLAEMAVFHTRQFFLNRDGYLVDNPKIGPDLTRHYWEPGNSKTFLELILGLTKKSFSAAALVDAINRPVKEAIEEARRSIAAEPKIPRFTGKVDLEARIDLVHGDRVLATNRDGSSFEQMSSKFSEELTSI
jgi:hypothetical protein